MSTSADLEILTSTAAEQPIPAHSSDSESASEEKASSYSVEAGAVVVRKSVRDLSAEEISDFVLRLQAVKKNGLYDQAVRVHSHNYYSGHVGPAFLPWHRKFLRDFEVQLQQVTDESLQLKPDPNFGLPYWDWENDDADYRRNLIWSEQLMGGNGSPVSSGPFSSWTTDKGDRLERDFGLGTASLPTAQDMMLALSEAVYDEAPWNADSAGGFRNLVEGWYERPFPQPGPQFSKRVDVWVGGTSASSSTSANDPVFWLHHCNIDRLWAIWQQKNPKELKAATSTYPKVVPNRPDQGLNDAMKPFAGVVTPASQLDYTSSYNYQYPLLFRKHGNKPLPSDRTQSDVTLFVSGFELYAAWRGAYNGIDICQTGDGQSWSKGSHPVSDDKTASAPRLATAPTSIAKDILLWFQGMGKSINLSARDTVSGKFSSAAHHPESAMTKSSPNSFSFGGTACVVWQGPQDEIFFSFSLDSTLTKWTQASQPLPNQRTNSALGIAGDGRRLYMWWRNFSDQLCMSYTNDPSGKGGWTDPRQPLPDDGTKSAISLTTLNGKHFLVFQGHDDGIYLSTSADGLIWTKTQRIIIADETSAAPSIQAFKGRLYVAYKDQTGSGFSITQSAI